MIADPLVTAEPLSGTPGAEMVGFDCVLKAFLIARPLALMGNVDGDDEVEKEDENVVAVTVESDGGDAFPL